MKFSALERDGGVSCGRVPHSTVFERRGNDCPIQSAAQYFSQLTVVRMIIYLTKAVSEATFAPETV